MLLTIEIPDDLVYAAGRLSPNQVPLQQLVVTALRAHVGGPAAAMYAQMGRKDLLALALKNLAAQPVGASFTLRALLVEQAWEALSDGDRRQLGKELKHAAEQSGLVGLPTATSAGAVYQRIA